MGAVVEFLARTSPLPGPLEGVPFGIKELMAVAGCVTSGGTSVVLDQTPAFADCPAVAGLRSAGALPFARTRTHEFAWGITSRHPRGDGVSNPLAPGRIAGGSSGGSAALVAAGVVPLALGTDTAGSIRIPAAFCGVIGFKPTWGRVPLTGVLPLSPTFDTAGILAADLSVLTLALAALGIDLGPTPAAARVGIIYDPTFPSLAADLSDVLAVAYRRLEIGAEVSPPTSVTLREVFGAIQAVEALAVHREVLGTWPSQAGKYGADVAERLRMAEATAAVAPYGRRERLRGAYLEAMAGVDVLVCPVAACSPSLIGSPDHVGGVPLREWVLPFTVPASVCGLPAMSVPVGRDAAGAPVGLQLIGAPGGEAALLAVAAKVLREGLGDGGQAPQG